MGLLSKLKNATGLVKKAVSSIPQKAKAASSVALKKAASTTLGKKVIGSAAGKAVITTSKKVLGNAVVKKIGGLSVKGGKIAATLLGPGKYLKAASIGIKAVKVGAGIATGVSVLKAVKGIGKKKSSSPASTPGSAPGDPGHPQEAAASGGSGVSKALKLVGAAAATATALYAGEQILEKIGVRGGAGLLGRDPTKKKKKKSSKKRKSSKRKRSRKARGRGTQRGGKRVSFTTADGRRVSFNVKRKKRKTTYGTLRYRRKIGRRGTGVAKTERKLLERLLRKYERD